MATEAKNRPQTAKSQGRPATAKSNKLGDGDNRPSSRQAWQDPSSLYNNDPDAVAQVPTVYGDATDQPVAMESEVFDKDGQVRVQQRHQKQPEKPKGCWNKFVHGIGAIWMTKQTEDTAYDRELLVKTTLRELIIYIFFLIVLCILTFGMTSSTMYYYTNVMSQLFLDTPTSDSDPLTFRTMSSMGDFWKFAEHQMLDGLYWDTWYNNMAYNESGFIYYENKVLGLPRLRMLKVKNGSCQVAESFRKEIFDCYDTYSESDEDRRSFGPANETAWIYQTESQLGGGSFWGSLSSYGGGGFVQTLSQDKDTTAAIIKYLKDNLWMDRGTRAVFLDFTVYNANINLFCVVKLVVEIPATGGLFPSWSFRTVKLIRYVTAFDYFCLACEGIFCAFILYYIIEESIEIKKHKCSYFKSFWNCLDVVVIIIAVCCIGFSVYRIITVDSKLTELLNQPNQYANFEFLSFAQTRFNDAIAVMVFFAWIKIFKYISFNKTMNQLSSTLSRCAKDVGGFAVMFFIFFFAYAQLGYLLFGSQIKDYSSFYDAVFTLLRTILGDFNFHDLEQANRVLGPIFFVSYVFFVFFVLLNMFLAIINDTYAEVKAELANQKNEFEIGDYFKRGYYNMLRKLNLKKDRMVDIQQALNSADFNTDKQVDFDEWRQQLKQRGYAEQEIEAMFAKYDMDGDRALDSSEQNKMQAELEAGKKAADKEMTDANNRPMSARSNFNDFDQDGIPDDQEMANAVGGRRRRRGGGGGIGFEEYSVLARRVDRMEHSISSICGKIDAVLVKLEAMEKIKIRHQEEMTKIMEQIHRSDGTESEKREQMEEMVNKELDRFGQDSGDKSASRPASTRSARRE